MKVNFAMEDELKCPVCHKLFVDPVILPCTHNLCSECAETLKSKNGTVCDLSPEVFGRSVDFDKVSLRSEAVFSDADSGYSAGSLRSNSSDQGRTISLSSINTNNPQQPSSPIAASPNSQGIHLPCLPESISCLTCPICQRTVFLDDRGVEGLTQNTLMHNIIKKFETRNGTHESSGVTKNSAEWALQSSNQNSLPKGGSIQGHTFQGNTPIIPNKEQLHCEMCDINSLQPASVRCEQCQVRYCSTCQRRFHPARGPLASHTITRLVQGNGIMRQNSSSSSASNGKTHTSPVKKRSQSVPPPKTDGANGKQNGIKLDPCHFHVVENMSMYCEECQVPLCYQCLEDGRHPSHDVKAIGSTYKTHKADLSRQMSALSNKARLAKDLVMHLRSVQDEIQKNSIDFESRAVAQCNALVEAINHKKQELIQRVTAEKEVKCKIVREQLQQCTMKLKQTTGLLEYCIEVMKDNDPAPFLQVSSGLIKRVSATEQQWTEHHLAPRTKSEFDFDLDASPLLQAIEAFSVTHRRVPEKPIIKVAECASNNNTVTLSWGIHPTSSVEAFVLELDDGARGPFRDVYHGKQTACTIDGLHFNSIYRARVSAYNRAGRSPCSDVVQLQTSEVAIFHMDPGHSHQDFKFTNNYCTLNCTNMENKASLANIGFSKGVHYWEYSVDRYDSSNPDVVVGIAYAKVDKNCILGKDKNAWSMYIDATRTWFLHKGEHTNRCEGGIDVGSRLGVLLDLDKQLLTFYVDQKQRGVSISLEDELVDPKTNRPKTRVFFPAASLDRHAQLTLWTGQHHPTQPRPGLYHSKSFTGPTRSNPYKTRMVGNHSICTNAENDSLRNSKASNSPTSTLQKRSQSSGDLKGQQQPHQRLYNSLPSQPVVKMKAPERNFHTLEKQPSIAEQNSETNNVVEKKLVKPAIKRKPPQLMNGYQQTRGRQQANRKSSFKVPPVPPIRRGSSSSSINTTGSSSKSNDEDTVSNGSLKTFQ
ncbi:E3 ubiquitin-protein ligase TRIM9-like [Styela clava]